jgi:hypothetical protein
MDFRLICLMQNSLRNCHQLILECPHYVKGFVSGKHNSNKHALAETDFLIFEILCKSFPSNKRPILFTRLTPQTSLVR